MIDLSRISSVVVAVAHPDDETILAGGTIARLADLGADIKVVYWHENVPGSNVAAAHVVPLLGGWVAQFDLLAADGGRVTEVAKHRARVESLTGTIGEADLVITHAPEDTHQDHRAMLDLVRSACRSNRSSILLADAPIPGGISRRPSPDVYIGIEGGIVRKRSALNYYRRTLAGKFDLTAEAYALRDALYGRLIGVPAAEGFRVERLLVR